MTTKVKFAAGRNIAMKVPPHQYEATVGFYRDVLGLKEITAHGHGNGRRQRGHTPMRGRSNVSLALR
jgi:catechol 2,3-dioxygenase-like lactoylglutathione lyase family enzyme